MEEFRTRSLAENTVRGYESDWRDFDAWCERQNRPALPADAETLCLYLVDCAQRLTKATLDRRIVAIGRRHKVAGYPNPAAEAKFREVMAGVRRMKKQAQRAKRPLLSEELREILEQLDPETAQGSRDRALLLIGFTGALRRSELVSLDVKDIRWTRQGMIINIRSSKMDQEGKGAELGIPFGRRAETCPVGLLKAWLKFAGIKKGPIFRPITKGGEIGAERLGDRAVALIVIAVSKVRKRGKITMS
jgi:site-specific recombinase XerD